MGARLPKQYLDLAGRRSSSTPCARWPGPPAWRDWWWRCPPSGWRPRDAARAPPCGPSLRSRRGRRGAPGVGVAGPPGGPGDAEWVLVHDAVRPFITLRSSRGCSRRHGVTGAATCGLPVRETVKRVRDDGTIAEATLDRDGTLAGADAAGLPPRPAVGGARQRRAATASPAPTTRCWWSGWAGGSPSCRGSGRT